MSTRRRISSSGRPSDTSGLLGAVGVRARSGPVVPDLSAVALEALMHNRVDHCLSPPSEGVESGYPVHPAGKPPGGCFVRVYGRKQGAPAVAAPGPAGKPPGTGREPGGEGQPWAV